MIRKLAAIAAACLAPGLVAVAPVQAQTATDAVDPGRLAAATATIDHIFPAGTYAKMMDGPLKSVMDMAMGSSNDITLRQIATAINLKPEEVNKLGDAKLGDIQAMLDPAHKQRMAAFMDAMMPTIGRIMGDFEPGMREGLRRAYARRFTKEQLDDMNRFFATPSGTAYAANSMLIQMDPEVMSGMTEAMPKIMQKLLAEMPDIIAKTEKATADLPKARKYEDLSKAERERLATLLGVAAKDIKR